MADFNHIAVIATTRVVSAAGCPWRATSHHRPRQQSGQRVAPMVGRVAIDGGGRIVVADEHALQSSVMSASPRPIRPQTAFTAP
jgi:hypothetical protein